MGVTVFFVLSGYLIMTVVRQSGYGLRRAVRIMPAYWFALIGITLLTGRQDFLDDPIGYLFFLHPVSGRTWGEFMSVSWTLRVEVVFYVLAPLLARLSPRWWTLLAGMSLSVAVVGHLTSWTYMTHPVAQLWHFLPGMLVTVPAIRVKMAEAVPLAVPLLLGPLLLGWTGHVDVASAAGAALLVARVVERPPAFGRWSRWAADLSYPMYLWHVDMLLAFGVVIGLAVALGASVVSWVGIERPAIRWGQAAVRVKLPSRAPERSLPSPP